MELEYVHFADSVIADTDTLWLNKYSKLFSWLRKLEHIFDINLKSDAQSGLAACKEPLWKKVQRMIELGMIKKVKCLTD